MFARLDEKVRGKHCDGIAGVIEEGKSVMEEDFDEQTMDACLIASGQRAEHYEMAAYGTLVAWAQVIGHDEAAGPLEGILNEEEADDQKLTGLAEGGINQAAAGGAQGDEAEEAEKPANMAKSKTSPTQPAAPPCPVEQIRTAGKPAEYEPEAAVDPPVGSRSSPTTRS